MPRPPAKPSTPGDDHVVTPTVEKGAAAAPAAGPAPPPPGPENTSREGADEAAAQGPFLAHTFARLHGAAGRAVAHPATKTAAAWARQAAVDPRVREWTSHGFKAGATGALLVAAAYAESHRHTLLGAGIRAAGVDQQTGSQDLRDKLAAALKADRAATQTGGTHYPTTPVTLYLNRQRGTIIRHDEVPTLTVELSGNQHANNVISVEDDGYSPRHIFDFADLDLAWKWVDGLPVQMRALKPKPGVRGDDVIQVRFLEPGSETRSRPARPQAVGPSAQAISAGLTRVHIAKMQTGAV